MPRPSRPFRMLAAGAAALAIAEVGFVVLSDTALAGPPDHGVERNEVDFGRYKFRPGTRWYRLNAELPAAVIVAVEQRIGKNLCKIEVAPGIFESNLKPCPADHARMLNVNIGLLRPRANTGNFIEDGIANMAYDMYPVQADVEIAKIIDEELVAFRARPAQSVVVADGAERTAPVAAEARPRPDPRAGQVQTSQGVVKYRINGF